MAEFVTIPVSFFEVAISYERPVFQLWVDRSKVLQDLFDALAPWTPNIDDTEFRNEGKPSEQGIVFKLPQERVSFFFGPAACKFTRDDADWAGAERTISILDAALTVLTTSGGVSLGRKHTSIALHVQPRDSRYIDLLRPLLPDSLAAIDAAPLMAIATVAKWEDHKVTIDGSALIANALFIRLERIFAASESYTEITSKLRDDESEVFRLLGIEEHPG